MSYIGNEPIVSATRTVTEVTATAGQTVFTANGGYTVGFLDVFINGSKLTSADFTATNGTTVTLTEAAQVNDIVRLEALGTFLASSALSNVNPNYTGALTGGTGVVNIGSGQLVKDASGNIGIGTASPSGNVHITSSGNTRQRIETTNTGAVAEIQFRNAAGEVHQIGSETSAGNAGYNGSTAYALCLEAGGGRDISFATNSTNRMRITSTGLLQFNSGYGSVATAYGCRAWVNFNGTGTVAIRGSGNVSSITDNGTGDYTVNYTNAMPDVNYAATIGFTSRQTGSGVNLAVGYWTTGNTSQLYSTTQLRLLVKLANGSSEDIGDICVAIFR